MTATPTGTPPLGRGAPATAGDAPATARDAPATDRGAPSPAEVAASLSIAGLVEVDASTRRRAEYSTDASLYRVPPLAVAFPRDADEVVVALDVARRLEVGLTLRGGGTSIAGNAVGPGIVLDTSRHLTAVGDLDPDARTVRVEPGVVLDDLQRRAAPHGLRFGPDPSTHDRCTVGGMIGNNACGTRALGYGRTVDNVVTLDVVTGGGRRLTAGPRDVVGPTHGPEAAGLHDALAALAERHGDAIGTHLDRFSRQVSGYGLHHLLTDRGADLARALVGSEGTCALVLGATLRLVPTPATTLLVVLGFPDVATAGDAVPALLPHGPVACEGIDRRIVDAVTRRRGPGAVPPLPDGGAWLFVELAGDDSGALRAAADALVADADATDHLAVGDVTAARALWRIREDGAALSSRSQPPSADTGGESHPAHAGWEDAAVPVERLGDYLRAFDALLVDHGLTTLPYGHLGDGCVHARIDLPLGPRGGPDRGVGAFRRFVEDAADLVAGFGGSMSGEHGDGRARSELLPRMYPPEVMDAFADFEALLDPDGVLNPGVLVRPRPIDADLRLPRTVADAGGFTFPGDGDDLGAAVHRCIGVGSCRADRTDRGAVMCPSYLATGDERDSTRGRARVLQEVVDGRLVTGGFAAPELHDALDLCLACKGCAVDCPAEVDVATYKAETLHRSYRGRLRPRSHYALGQLPRWAGWAAVAPGPLSRALDLPVVARLARWVAGVDPRRDLPRLSPTPFSRAVRRRPAAGTPEDAATRPRVLLWADTFSDRFDPEVAVATVRVLEAAGYRVEVPGTPRCCGLTWISTGQLDGARRVLRETVDDLAAWARAGVPIVGLEPPCVAVLRDDAPRLLGVADDAARDVAAATRTLAELLTATDGWRPPRLDGVLVLAQPHCHHHAVMGWDTDRALLEAAGAEVETVGGCCGLAGNWGVERGHHDVSVAVAETALLPAVRAASPGTVLLADGFSCRTQLDHLAGRRAVHLAQLLASHLGAATAR